MPDPENPKKSDPDGPVIGGDPPVESPDTQDPPPTELQEWRKRALDAEELVERLTAELAAATAELDALRRERALDALLTEAGAIDAETVRALLAARLAGAPDGAADPAALIEELRREKPFLFSRPTPPNPPRSAMVAATSAPPTHDDLGAALELAATGDRAALLRYLRLRRAA